MEDEDFVAKPRILSLCGHTKKILGTPEEMMKPNCDHLLAGEASKALVEKLSTLTEVEKAQALFNFFSVSFQIPSFSLSEAGRNQTVVGDGGRNRDQDSS